jgi:plasmid segregation protein ParM
MHLRQPLRRSWNCDYARVLVIDAGYFSIDWAVITNGRDIRSTIGSSAWALNYACGFVREAVLRGYRIMLDDDEIERVLWSGQSIIRLQDHLVDLAPYLTSALDRVIDAALIEIRAMWCRLEEGEPELLALAGGGAKHFKDQIARAFPRVKLIVLEDPLVSNAVGLWHIGAERLISSRMARR